MKRELIVAFLGLLFSFHRKVQNIRHDDDRYDEQILVYTLTFIEVSKDFFFIMQRKGRTYANATLKMLCQ